jgi:hypothetical protein
MTQPSKACNRCGNMLIGLGLHTVLKVEAGELSLQGRDLSLCSSCSRVFRAWLRAREAEAVLSSPPASY